VDAGYRHAYWTLEDAGIVNRASVVDTTAILEAREYWDVEKQWLRELLPAVRRFLKAHAGHEVRFGEDEEVGIPDSAAKGLFDWLMEAGFVLEELPRYYTERLAFRTWDEVTAHIQASTSRPRWWADEEERAAAQEKFASLVAKP
jgi:hypothetical protein